MKLKTFSRVPPISLVGAIQEAIEVLLEEEQENSYTTTPVCTHEVRDQLVTVKVDKRGEFNVTLPGSTENQTWHFRDDGQDPIEVIRKSVNKTIDLYQ